MTLSEAPSWVRKFLETKAPWWLECDLEILSVNEDKRTARVKKEGFIYTLDIYRNHIR